LISRPRKRSTRWAVVVGLILAAGANLLAKYTLKNELWRENPADKWDRLGRQEWPWPAPPGSNAPVVLLAASGGGSRAAVYTGLALHHLQADRPRIAEQLQAISSVSGGSLASAAYIVRLFENRKVDDLNEALRGDFLLPTLFGALTPGQTRGSAIEEEWQEGPVGLHKHTLRDLAQSWRQSRRSPVPPFPIPLFNSSTLDGHDVVISPLAKGLYTRPGLDDEASDPGKNAYDLEATDDGDSPTWVYYRDGTYSLEDLLADFNPPLSSAVRASANFPFGFPLVRLETERPLFFSPLAADREAGRKKLVRLTDGGALSNSGMWSLFNLLMHPDNQGELRERGVLLIMVEASRMPSYRQLDRAVNSLWGTIEDQGPVGQRLHREMLELLERTYGSRIAVIQLDLVPRESFNVFTTWALDRGSLDQLKKSFDERWKSELPNLDGSWTHLLKPGAQGPYPTPERAPYMARRRPPLD
ncbi:MAG TPA: patatin-like phospholipase family protein, partial [Thermoanaerobaculia bacterium]|nr:patatin-like phospholipase family protein [Thermoanaerobaculia bacterium]